MRLELPSLQHVIAASLGAGFLLSASALLRLKQRSFEMQRREERTRIVFGALQVAASVFGSYMLADRHRHLDASIANVNEPSQPTPRSIQRPRRAKRPPVRVITKQLRPVDRPVQFVDESPVRERFSYDIGRSIPAEEGRRRRQKERKPVRIRNDP